MVEAPFLLAGRVLETSPVRPMTTPRPRLALRKGTTYRDSCEMRDAPRSALGRAAALEVSVYRNLSRGGAPTLPLWVGPQIFIREGWARADPIVKGRRHAASSSGIGMSTYLAIDTCVWINVASRPSLWKALDHLQKAIHRRSVTLVVPSIIRDELKRHLPETATKAVKALISQFDSAKQATAWVIADGINDAQRGAWIRT